MTTPAANNISTTPPGMRKTPIVLGVLNIVFGALVAAWSLFGLLSQGVASSVMDMAKNLSKVVPKAPGMPDLPNFYEQLRVLMEEMKPYLSAILIVKVVMSVGLVWIGWGLYRRVSSFRRLAIFWSIGALAINIGDAIFQLGFYLPRMEAIMSEMYKNMPMGMGSFQASMSNVGGTAGAIGGILFNSAYPVVLTILMARASAKNDLI